MSSVFDQIIAYIAEGRYGSNLYPGMDTSHYHDVYELYVFLGEKMTYFLENKVFKLQKNDIIIIKRLTYHRTLYVDSKDDTRVNLSFPASILEEVTENDIRNDISKLLENTRYISGSSYNNDVFLSSLNSLIALCKKKTEDRSTGFRKFIKLIDLLLILSSVSLTGPDEQLSETKSPPSDISSKISDIIDMINGSFREELSLESVSLTFGISKYYLSRKFKQTTGMGFVDFVNSKRLSEAEKLLKNTEYTVTKISELVGYQDHNYFIRLFKRSNSVSPGRYRKMNTRDPDK